MVWTKLVKIGPRDLEKKKKIWKVYDNDDADDAVGQQTQIVIRKAHVSPWLRWAKKENMKYENKTTENEIVLYFVLLFTNLMPICREEVFLDKRDFLNQFQVKHFQKFRSLQIN